MSEVPSSCKELSEITQTSEFSNPNLEACQNKFKSKNVKGGPYSKKDKYSRMEEVGKLHFEYGYSAKKISESIGVNRNTINKDIKQLYKTFEEHWKKTSSISLLQNHIESVIAQKTRLREELDNTQNISEKLAIEKMILQVETKINQFQLRKGEFGAYKTIC